MADLLSVAEAQSQILSAFQPGTVEQVALLDAIDRVLFEDIQTRLDLPPFDNSSVDGFAVRAQDVTSATASMPVQLVVTGDIPAGTYPSRTLQAGEAMRIMTGAPVPDGADAVVAVEQTNFPYREFRPEVPAEVQILRAVHLGDNVRPKGQDIHVGQTILTRGQKLRPQDIGMLASIGVSQVPVYQQPCIALLSTGDELLHPEQPLSPGKIYDSNSFVLAALIRKYGGKVLPLGFAPDDPDQVRDLLFRAVEEKVQLILTSAGVSVGAFDYVRSLIEQYGRLNLWRVNMRPGKPLTFGEFQDIPLIGLPGNPVSAYVGFQVFVVPVLRQLAGLPEYRRPVVSATLLDAVESDGRETFLRGIVTPQSGQFTARLTGHQGSGNLYSLVQANALLIVPSGVKSLPSGSQINAWLFDEDLVN